VDNNIKEVQELYKDMEQKKESSKGRVEDKEVILIKPYEVFSSSSTMKSSFIDDEVDNLIKYIVRYSSHQGESPQDGLIE